MVTEDDENILKHLTVLSISDIDGGFRISLQFAPNDYFSDKELWKEFRYKNALFVSRRCFVLLIALFAVTLTKVALM